MLLFTRKLDTSCQAMRQYSKLQDLYPPIFRHLKKGIFHVRLKARHLFDPL